MTFNLFAGILNQESITLIVPGEDFQRSFTIESPNSLLFSSVTPSEDFPTEINIIESVLSLFIVPGEDIPSKLAYPNILYPSPSLIPSEDIFSNLESPNSFTYPQPIIQSEDISLKLAYPNILYPSTALIPSEDLIDSFYEPNPLLISSIIEGEEIQQSFIIHDVSSIIYPAI